MSEISELCKQCGGKCCKNHAWFSDAEYIRLVKVIGNDAAQAAEPVRMRGGWMFKTAPCPGVTDTGCMLPYADRPFQCRIYPFVPIPTVNPDGSQTIIPLLAVQTCPYWDTFGGGVEDVKKEIENDGRK